MKKWLLLVLILTFMLPASSFAKRKKYEVVDVANGGSIAGTIKAAEMVIDPTKKTETDLPEEIKICGTEFKMNKFVISPDLGLKNVIVALQDVPKGKAMPKENLHIDIRNCQFQPLTAVAFKGAHFVVQNSDPIFHNISMGLIMKHRRSMVYNLALPNQNMAIKKPVRRTGMYNVKCDAHKWMRAYIFAADNPYVALTDENGQFEITDIPSGEYAVLVWHEGFGEVKKTIDVKAGEATTLDHTFAKP
jgi:plastocyanin